MSIIPQHFLNAVVPVGIRTRTSITWVGTGFFVSRKTDNDGNIRPFLVTNKHVVKGQKNIVIRMKRKQDSELKDIDAPLENVTGAIYKLHKDTSIDVAVIPLNGKFIVDNNLDFPAFDIDSNAMTSSELRENGVDEGSLVHMLGFPMRLVNANSMLPICRLGCVARMSEEQIKEQHSFLVDIQNFPGNSGSPIILRPDLMSIVGTKNLINCVLMGIIHSYIPYKETLINAQTQEPVEIRSENSGLANAHPVEYIREIIDEIQPKLI